MRVAGTGARAFVCVVALAFSLFARGADAAPGSPSVFPDELPHLRLLLPNAGLLGSAGFGFDGGVAQPAGAGWTWLDHQMRSDVHLAMSLWGRAELGLALPIVFDADAHSWIASRVTAGPIHVESKIALARGRSFGLALWLGSDLPLDEAGRVSMQGGIIAGYSVGPLLVAANLGVTASTTYRLANFAVDALPWGAGLDVRVARWCHLFAEAYGDVPLGGAGAASPRVLGGARFREGPTSLVLGAGASLPPSDPIGALFALRLDHRFGRDAARAEAPDTIPLDALVPGVCVETTCSPEERAAVIEHLTIYVGDVAGVLRTTADRARRSASLDGDRYYATIVNDLTIEDDAARKRELSIRFLLHAFAERGTPITRAYATRIVTASPWGVLVGRRIDEPSVVYTSRDLVQAARLYAQLLDEDARDYEKLRKALRDSWAETDQMLLDVGRAHVNGAIGVVNGVLDLPLLPCNFYRAATDREAVHGLGRIPLFEYQSEWGRKHGASMEAGVALAFMNGAAARLLAGGMGRLLGPIVARVLSPLGAWTVRGVCVGGALVRVVRLWMAGSVVAGVGVSAIDLMLYLEALRTGVLALPGHEPRALNEDDVEHLFVTLLMNLLTVKHAVEGVRAAEEAAPPPGRNGERLLPGRDLTAAQAEWLRVRIEQARARGDLARVRQLQFEEAQLARRNLGLPPYKDEAEWRAEEEKPWEKPPGCRLPQEGTWSGTPGDSLFTPANPAEFGLKPGEVVPFRKGRVDLSKWAVDEFEVQGMNGKRGHDPPLVRKKLAERKGCLNRDGTPNGEEARRWLKKHDLAMHHAGGNTVQIVPGLLHQKTGHTGGAFDLRNP